MKKRASRRWLPLILAGIVLLALAGAWLGRSSLRLRPSEVAGPEPPPVSTAPSQAIPLAPATRPTPTPPDGELVPNETGQIMVLMYHRFDAKPGDWNRTPADFRRDLETLHREGYRLLSLRDLLSGRITTPRGYTPVVLTFDDGARSQFNYLEQDGQLVVDPDSAVGILETFAKAHPDMGLAGTFYLNADPFGQPKLAQAKLAHLTAEGFALGNHTVYHTNLRRATAEEGRKALAGLVALVGRMLPGYDLDTLALPFGALPHDETVAAAGTYDGVSYQHRAVLLVGANPAPSPYTAAFAPLRLPRVQASETELGRWLAYFKAHPDARFVSDGRAEQVTVPAARRAELGEGLATLEGRQLVVLTPAEPSRSAE